MSVVMPSLSPEPMTEVSSTPVLLSEANAGDSRRGCVRRRKAGRFVGSTVGGHLGQRILGLFHASQRIRRTSSPNRTSAVADPRRRSAGDGSVRRLRAEEASVAVRSQRHVVMQGGVEGIVGCDASRDTEISRLVAPDGRDRQGADEAWPRRGSENRSPLWLVVTFAVPTRFALIVRTTGRIRRFRFANRQGRRESFVLPLSAQQEGISRSLFKLAAVRRWGLAEN